MPSFPWLRISPLSFLETLESSISFLIFLCMGALLGVMQFPWSQLFDWAHMHPGRLVNEFDFVWAVVCFFFCFYLSSALLESSLPRRRVEGRSFPNISSLLFMAIESRGEARNMRLEFLFPLVAAVR